MAANTVYISAGLPVAKNSGQAPSSGVNTAYVSAGLPPEVVAEPPAGLIIPVARHHYQQQGIG